MLWSDVALPRICLGIQTEISNVEVCAILHILALDHVVFQTWFSTWSTWCCYPFRWNLFKQVHGSCLENWPAYDWWSYSLNPCKSCLWQTIALARTDHTRCKQNLDNWQRFRGWTNLTPFSPNLQHQRLNFCILFQNTLMYQRKGLSPCRSTSTSIQLCTCHQQRSDVLIGAARGGSNRTGLGDTKLSRGTPTAAGQSNMRPAHNGLLHNQQRQRWFRRGPWRFKRGPR